MTSSSIDFKQNQTSSSFKFRVVLCRIRLVPIWISKIKWLEPVVGNLQLQQHRIVLKILTVNNIRDQWILVHSWEATGIREKLCICLIILRISLKTVTKTNHFFLNLLDGPLRTGTDFDYDHFRSLKNNKMFQGLFRPKPFYF